MRSWGSLQRNGDIQEFGGKTYYADQEDLWALVRVLKSDTPAWCAPVNVQDDRGNIIGFIYLSTSDEKQLVFIQGSNEYQIRVEDFLYVMSSSQTAALIKDGQRDTIHKDQTTLEACFS